jgi:hypothetical protein
MVTFFIAAFWMWLVLIAGFIAAKLWAIAFAQRPVDDEAISRTKPRSLRKQRRPINTPDGANYLKIELNDLEED